MCFRFCPNAVEPGELRGAPLFREWKRTRYGYPHETHIMNPGMHSMEITNCETWFILMPGNRAVADYIVSARHPVIVDYHGDVLRLIADNPPIDMVLAGLTITPEVWEWWSQPEPQDSMRRSLEAATVVTTPWPHLVEPLREINNLNVMLVPDYNPLTEGIEFRNRWEMVNGFRTGWEEFA